MTASKEQGQQNQLVKLIVVLLVVGGVWRFSGFGSAVNANCMVNGFGIGECEFTNEGFAPGSACFYVKVVRHFSGQSASSSRVCSGTVWPGDATSRKASVEHVQTVCAADFMKGETWMDVCEVRVTEDR